MTGPSTNDTFNPGAYPKASKEASVEVVNGNPTNLTVNPRRVFVDSSASTLKYTLNGSTFQTATVTNAPGGTPVFNADTGLTRWRNALTRLRSGEQTIFNLNFVGDSITEGQGSGGGVNSLFPTNGFVGRIRTALSAKYGDCGDGLVPEYSPTGASRWTFAGSGWVQTQTGYGVGDVHAQGTANLSRATISFNGTGYNFIYATNPTAGTIGFYMDGSSTASLTVNANVASGGIANAVSSVTGLTNGAHTAQIRNDDVGGKILYFIGGWGNTGTKGIRVNDGGRSGGKTVDLSQTWSLDVTESIPGLRPTLTVIGLMANDSLAATSLATYKAQLVAIRDRSLQFGDVMFISNGMRTSDTTPITQQMYVDAMRDVALERNCCFVDLYTRWGGSSAIGNTLGVFFDGVHPNDAGHQDLATAILQVIDP